MSDVQGWLLLYTYLNGISKPKENVGALKISNLKTCLGVIPRVVPNELSTYLMLKINCRQCGDPIRSDPNLGPEYQEVEPISMR